MTDNGLDFNDFLYGSGENQSTEESENTKKEQIENVNDKPLESGKDNAEVNRRKNDIGDEKNIIEDLQEKPASDLQNFTKGDTEAENLNDFIKSNNNVANDLNIFSDNPEKNVLDDVNNQKNELIEELSKNPDNISEVSDEKNNIEDETISVDKNIEAKTNDTIQEQNDDLNKEVLESLNNLPEEIDTKKSVKENIEENVEKNIDQTTLQENHDTEENDVFSSNLEDEILNSLQNLPDEKPVEEKKVTFEELAKANRKEMGIVDKEEKKTEEIKQQEEEQKEEEEEEIIEEDEKAIIEKKRQDILAKQVKADENLKKEESIAGEVKKLEDIDLDSIDYSEFDKINEEHIDLFYLLNDTKANPEFLDEDLLAQSKKEEAIREAKRQERQDMDFELEALVDNNVVKVDLTGIIDDLEKK